MLLSSRSVLASLLEAMLGVASGELAALTVKALVCSPQHAASDGKSSNMTPWYWTVAARGLFSGDAGFDKASEGS
jgi:hypothetical protein